MVQKENLPDSYLSFTVRAFVIPTGDTYAKISLLLFPLPKDMLITNHPQSGNPCFPGITLFSGEFPLLPRSTERPLLKKWGCPLAPDLIPSADLEDAANTPRTPLLRSAIAQVLRKVIRPDAKLNNANLIARWNEICEHGKFYWQ